MAPIKELGLVAWRRPTTGCRSNKSCSLDNCKKKLNKYMYIEYIEYIYIHTQYILYRLIRCGLRGGCGVGSGPPRIGPGGWRWPRHRSQPTIVFPAQQQAQPTAPGPGLGRASCGEFTIWLQR